MRTAIGIQAQQSVAARFAEIYGQRRVSTGTGFSMGLGGSPDVLLKLNPHPVAVEVKSVQAFTTGLGKVKGKKRKVRMPRLGNVKGYIYSWYYLTNYARSRLMYRMLVAEYRVGGKQHENFYMWISGREVDEYIKKALERRPGTKTYNFSFYDMHRLGQVLKFKEGELERWLNAEDAIESSQTKLQ